MFWNRHISMPFNALPLWIWTGKNLLEISQTYADNFRLFHGPEFSTELMKLSLIKIVEYRMFVFFTIFPYHVLITPNGVVCPNFGQPCPNFFIYKTSIFAGEKIVLKQLWMDCQFCNLSAFEWWFIIFVACLQHLQSE